MSLAQATAAREISPPPEAPQIQTTTDSNALHAANSLAIASGGLVSTDPLSTDPLSTDPLSTDPQTTNPLSTNPQTSGSTTSASSVPVISLTEAIQRAQKNHAAFATTRAESRATALDPSIARAALLPNAVYHNQYLYTQPSGQHLTPAQTGTQPTPRFIANNAVHEYVSQGSVTETLGILQLAELRRADAAAARAKAELEIARRGLVGTVVGLYYNSLATARKVAVAERALNEANTFTDLTGKREDAREVAHADVVKAQLQQQGRERDLSEARLAADRARLELGVLLFPDPRTPYQVQPAGAPAPLPDRAALQTTATASTNPEIRSAFASLRASDASVLTARGAYLPELVFNYSYGIDAPQFARNGPDGIHNLGYSATATLDIPIWDWLATEHRVKQSEIRRDAVRVALTAAQRRIIADFEEIYDEADAARRQSASLDASVKTADESLRLTKLRYSQGEATVLEVVDAQNALTTAENAREDGIVRYQQAIANLQTLTGTL